MASRLGGAHCLALLIALQAAFAWSQSRSVLADTVVLRTVYCTNGMELAAALADQSVGSAQLLSDFKLTDADWTAFGPPIALERDFVIAGPASHLATLDMGFVQAKVQLANGSKLILDRIVIINFRSGAFNQAPGVDMLALTRANDTGTLLMRDGALVLRACFPLDIATLANQALPARPAWCPGTNIFVFPAPQPSNCSNSTAAPFIDRCYAYVARYVDVALPGADVQASGNVKANGYAVQALNSMLLCESVMTHDCINHLGPLGCTLSTLHTLSPLTLPYTNTSTPAAAAVTTDMGGDGQGGGGGGGARSRTVLGATLGGVLGGLVLLGTVLLLTMFLLRQRRGRQCKQREDGPGSKAQASGVAITPCAASSNQSSHARAADSERLCSPGGGQRGASCKQDRSAKIGSTTSFASGSSADAGTDCCITVQCEQQQQQQQHDQGDSGSGGDINSGAPSSAAFTACLRRPTTAPDASTPSPADVTSALNPTQGQSRMMTKAQDAATATAAATAAATVVVTPATPHRPDLQLNVRMAHAGSAAAAAAATAAAAVAASAAPALAVRGGGQQQQQQQQRRDRVVSCCGDAAGLPPPAAQADGCGQDHQGPGLGTEGAATAAATAAAAAISPGASPEGAIGAAAGGGSAAGAAAGQDDGMGRSSRASPTASAPATAATPGGASSSDGGAVSNVVTLLPVVLGRGAFGRVHEGVYQGSRVAVKVVLEPAFGMTPHTPQQAPTKPSGTVAPTSEVARGMVSDSGPQQPQEQLPSCKDTQTAGNAATPDLEMASSMQKPLQQGAGSPAAGTADATSCMEQPCPTPQPVKSVGTGNNTEGVVLSAPADVRAAACHGATSAAPLSDAQPPPAALQRPAVLATSEAQHKQQHEQQPQQWGVQIGNEAEAEQEGKHHDRKQQQERQQQNNLQSAGVDGEIGGHRGGEGDASRMPPIVYASSAGVDVPADEAEASVDWRLMAQFAQEVEVLGRCCHPNVVRLLAACLTPPRLCLVMELMEGSLERLIFGGGGAGAGGSNSHDGGLMPLSKVLHIALQICQGLEYLHPTIVHRDLKPANVLINGADTPHPVAKLTDFGLSRLRLVTLPTLHPEAGTPAYQAPECYDAENDVVTHHADMYAFGVVLWVMLTGQRPWKDHSLVAIAFKVTVLRERLPLDQLSDRRCPPKLKALIRQCWEHDPLRRPAAAEAVKQLAMILQEAAQRLVSSPTLRPGNSSASVSIRHRAGLGPGSGGSTVHHRSGGAVAATAAAAPSSSPRRRRGHPTADSGAAADGVAGTGADGGSSLLQQQQPLAGILGAAAAGTAGDEPSGSGLGVLHPPSAGNAAGIAAGVMANAGAGSASPLRHSWRVVSALRGSAGSSDGGSGSTGTMTLSAQGSGAPSGVAAGAATAATGAWGRGGGGRGGLRAGVPPHAMVGKGEVWRRTNALQQRYPSIGEEGEEFGSATSMLSEAALLEQLRDVELEIE